MIHQAFDALFLAALSLPAAAVVIGIVFALIPRGDHAPSSVHQAARA